MPTGLAALSGFLEGFSNTYVKRKEMADQQQRKLNQDLAQGIMGKAFSDPTFTPTPEMEKIVKSAYGAEGSKALLGLHQQWQQNPAFQAISKPATGDALNQYLRTVGNQGTPVPLDQALAGVPRTLDPGLMAQNPMATAMALPGGPQIAALGLKQRELGVKTEGQQIAARLMQGATGGSGGLPEGTSVHYGPLTVRGVPSEATRIERRRALKQTDIDVQAENLGWPSDRPDPTTPPAPTTPGETAPTMPHPGAIPAAAGASEPIPPPTQQNPQPKPGEGKLEFIERRKAERQDEAKQRAEDRKTLGAKAATIVLADGRAATPTMTMADVRKRGGYVMTTAAATTRENLRTSLPLLKRMIDTVDRIYPQDPQGTGAIGEVARAGGRGLALKAGKVFKVGKDLQTLETVNNMALHLVRNILNEKGNLRGDVMSMAQKNLFGAYETPESARAKLEFWTSVFASGFAATNAPLPPNAIPLLKDAVVREDLAQDFIPNDAGGALPDSPAAETPPGLTFTGTGGGSYTVEAP